MGKSLLIVDQDQQTSEVVAPLFPTYETITAETARNGLKLARKGIFDLYLIDNRLPVLNEVI